MNGTTCNLTGSWSAETSEMPAREKALTCCVAALLLGFGAYQSILYFGHQPVPNPDFTGFLRVGRELLAFDVPSSFKRAPVLGLLQVGLSRFVAGPHPELTAGWLLNAILHPLTLVLLWLVGRQIVGWAAAGIALVAAIHPWSLRNVFDPVAETTLYFCILTTFYCIFTKSRWRYVLAAVATMVRYDAAALILVAFALDAVQSRSARERLRALAWAALATVPLAVWMAATILNFSDEGETHYLNEWSTGGSFGNALVRYIAEIWFVASSPLFSVPKALPRQAAAILSTGITIPLFVGFCFGALHSLVERRWKVLGLLIFLLVYVIVHALHSFVLARFCSTIWWIVPLIAVYGLQSCRQIVRAERPVPQQVRSTVPVLVTALLALWAISLAPALPELAEQSMRSTSVPYVSLVVAGLLLAAGWLCLGMRHPARDLCALALLSLVIVSNQFTLVRVVGDGRRDIEFKRLADWYRDNAGSHERLATTYAGVLGLYVPQHRMNFVHTGGMKAADPNGFIRNCRENGIAYVAWDSRLGLRPSDRYYELWGLENLAALAEPENTEPYEFLTRIKGAGQSYINVFRLRSFGSAKTERASAPANTDASPAAVCTTAAPR